MYSFRVSIGPYDVNVVTPLRLDLLYAQLQSANRPPLVDIEPGHSSSTYLLEHHDTSSETSLWLSNALNHMVVRCPMTQMGEELIHLAHLLIERRMQLDGYVTAHCAAVVRGGTAVLLLGKIGSGKTTTAIQLCREHGCQLIGNDLRVVGSIGSDLQVIAGTRFFHLRYISIRNNMPDLMHLFSKMDRDSWLYKVFTTPERIGVSLFSGHARINGAYLVHVDNTQPTIYEEEGDSLVTRLYLNENFSSYIRATTTPFLIGHNLSFADYVPPLDCPVTYARRVYLINRLLDGIGV